MIFRAGNQESLRRVPVARLHVPIMASQNRVASSSCEIEYFQRGIVRCRQKLGIAGTPCQISDGIVMRVINRLDIIEVGTPIFDIALLSARY